MLSLAPLLTNAPPPAVADDRIDANSCGAVKTVTGRRQPLVCTLPRGHQGPHGVALGGLEPHVRWSAS
jgi:hypothetical protein